MAQASYLLFSWLDLHVEKNVEFVFGSIARIGESQTGTEATSVVALLCAQLGEKRKEEDEKEKALLLPLEKSCRGNLRKEQRDTIVAFFLFLVCCIAKEGDLAGVVASGFKRGSGIKRGFWPKIGKTNLAEILQENSEQAALYFGLLEKSVYGNSNYASIFCRRKSFKSSSVLARFLLLFFNTETITNTNALHY